MPIVLLHCVINHLFHAIGGLGGTRDGVELHGNIIAVIRDQFSLELALELLRSDLSAQSRGLGFVIEVGTNDGLAVGRNGDIARDRSPEAFSSHGDDADGVIDIKPWKAMSIPTVSSPFRIR